MKKYLELLTQLGLTPDQLSKSIQKKIKQYETLHAILEESKVEVAKDGLSDRKKIKLENEIKDAEATLADLDTELQKDITRFNKNKDSYKANTERLKNGKKGAAAAASTDPAGGTDGGDGGANTDPGTDGGAGGDNTDTTDPAGGTDGGDDKDDKKKKKNGFAAFIGILAVAGLAAIGIKAWNDR